MTDGLLVLAVMAASVALGIWGLLRQRSLAIRVLSAVGALLPAVSGGLIASVLAESVLAPGSAVVSFWVLVPAILGGWVLFGWALARQGLYLAEGAYALGRRDVGYLAYAGFLILLASLGVAFVGTLAVLSVMTDGME